MGPLTLGVYEPGALRSPRAVLQLGLRSTGRPLDLARWLLGREGQGRADRLEERVGSGRTETLHLQQPAPVYIVYFTAFAADDGEVIFRRDIYDRDEPIATALRSRS